MSWRTVPAFAAGVLATLVAALLVRCRGPGRADSAAVNPPITASIRCSHLPEASDADPGPSAA